MNKNYESPGRRRDDVDHLTFWKSSPVTFKRTVAAILAGAVTFLIFVRLIAPDQPERLVGPALIALVAVGSWHQLARGSMQAAVGVLAFGVWMAATGISVFYGGVHTPVIAAYPIIILMFGWLTSRRTMLALAALTMAVIVCFVVFDAWGWLPYAPPSPPVLHGVVQMTLVALAALLTRSSVNAYQDRLTELGQIGSDLSRRTLDLEISKAELNRAQAVAKVGNWVYDLATNKLRLSAETCRIFALPEGAAVSREAYLARTHVQDRHAVDQAWQLVLAGEAFDQEHRIMVGNAIRWIRQRAELEFAADGTALRAVGITQDITERKQAQTAMLMLHQDLNESRQRLRDLSAQNEARREDERKHIAREVHDELGQVLTALRIDISLLGMRFGVLDPAVCDKVMSMKGLVDRAILGVRNVAMNLRPTALDLGLVPAIEWLRDEFTRNTAVACVLHAPQASIELDEARAVVVFRIVQESLTNITRYAQASRVDITLDQRGNELRVEVCDNGQGFDLEAQSDTKSFGLLGMRERALAMGGQVDITSAPGRGTVIDVTIPFVVDTLAKDRA